MFCFKIVCIGDKYADSGAFPPDFPTVELREAFVRTRLSSGSGNWGSFGAASMHFLSCGDCDSECL